MALSQAFKTQETAPATPSSMVRLSDDLLPKVRDYADAKQTKKRADAEGRAADAVIKGTGAMLLEKMAGAPAAICGEMILTTKSTASADAALTLTDGSKILWKDVTMLVIGNKTVMTTEIQTLFGGRSGSTSVEVAGN